MKRTKKFVERQFLREKPGNSDSYERYLSGGKHTEDGTPIEDIRANPDSLAEGEQLWGNSEMTRVQEIMGDAVAHLQGRQREVYLLTMREGKSLAEAAEILGVSKSAAQTFRDRAIKFITAYCQRIAAKE